MAGAPELRNDVHDNNGKKCITIQYPTNSWKLSEEAKLPLDAPKYNGNDASYEDHNMTKISE